MNTKANGTVAIATSRMVEIVRADYIYRQRLFRDASKISQYELARQCRILAEASADEIEATIRRVRLILGPNSETICKLLGALRGKENGWRRAARFTPRERLFYVHAHAHIAKDDSDPFHACKVWDRDLMKACGLDRRHLAGAGAIGDDWTFTIRANDRNHSRYYGRALAKLGYRITYGNS